MPKSTFHQFLIKSDLSIVRFIDTLELESPVLICRENFSTFEKLVRQDRLSPIHRTSLDDKDLIDLKLLSLLKEPNSELYQIKSLKSTNGSSGINDEKNGSADSKSKKIQYRLF